MSSSDREEIKRLATRLVDTWADDNDDGEAFRNLALTVLEERKMDAVLTCAADMMEDPLPTFEAIRDIATAVTGRGTVRGVPHSLRVDLFGIAVAGKRSEIDALLSGSFIYQIGDEMKAANWIHPSSSTLCLRTPLAPEQMAKLGADTLRYMTEQAYRTLTGAEPEADGVWQTILERTGAAVDASLPDRDAPETFMLLGARIFRIQEGFPVEPDHLAPDLLYEDADEDILDRAAATESEMDAGMKLLLDRIGMPEVRVSLPRTFGGALIECASLRLEEWFSHEAAILRIDVPETGYEAIHVAPENSDYLVSATIGDTILGPVALPVLLCGTETDAFIAVAGDDESLITIHEDLKNFPGRGLTGAKH